MSSGIATTETLARQDVRRLELYAPGTLPCTIDLSDNTNLWGAPPAAMRALAALQSSGVSRYPALHSRTLHDAILRYTTMSEHPQLDVVTGCGSDDVIDSTMRAFGEPGDRIAFSAPTFSMIPTFARLNGLDPVSIPLTSVYDVDADRLVGVRAKITYLCSPNNPTATALSRSAVEYVVAQASGIVILDEAYAEFAPESFVDLITDHERLLVTRTFSKAFGLAGLRVGYGVGHRALVGLVERARGPYKVSVAAERAALGALEESVDGIEWVRTQAALVAPIRERLSGELRHLGLTPLPSAANFVFVPTARAADLSRALRETGVLVRLLSGLPRDLPPLAESDGAALRIGVGPWPMMQAALEALAKALA